MYYFIKPISLNWWLFDSWPIIECHTINAGVPSFSLSNLPGVKRVALRCGDFTHLAPLVPRNGDWKKHRVMVYASVYLHPKPIQCLTITKKICMKFDSSISAVSWLIFLRKNSPEKTSFIIWLANKSTKLMFFLWIGDRSSRHAGRTSEDFCLGLLHHYGVHIKVWKRSYIARSQLMYNNMF